MRALACLLSLMVACAPDSDGQSSSELSAAGTGIEVTETATGFWEHRIAYDWTLTKSVLPDHITIDPGGSGSVGYTLTATRNLFSDVTVYGARGEICVTNSGAVDTEGLAITAQAQIHEGPGPWAYTGVAVNVPVSGQLGPGETHCYPYEVTFDAVPGATYRNTARVTITNHSGHLGVAFGPGGSHGVIEDFALPTSCTTVYTDAEADIVDVLTCPTGVTCTLSALGPWHVTDSQTITYSTLLAVSSGTACNTHLIVNNSATLTEATTLVTHDASASVDIYTDVCAYQGCSPGYWKNHLASWPAWFLMGRTIGEVFVVPSDYSLGSLSLLQGLALRGGPSNEGAAEILSRAGIAAVLNASHTGVSYPLTAATVISRVNAALGSDDRATMLTLATELDLDNNLWCPLH